MGILRSHIVYQPAKLVLFFLMILLVSCIKRIDLDTGEFSKQPVVNAIICAGDTAKIYLSYSFPSYEETTLEKIDSAFVQLTDSKGVVYTFDHYSPIDHHGALYKSELVPSINETYKLSIEIEGFNSISSMTIIPEPVQIDSLCYDLIPDDNTENVNLRISTWFKDPSAQNFYYHKIFVSGGEWQPCWIDSIQEYRQKYVYNQELYDLYWETDDPVIGGANKFMKNKLTVFNDQLIKDMSYDLKLDIPVDVNSTFFGYDTIMISSFLYTVSPEFYYYAESLNQQYAMSGNPFIEPVTDYTNIQNARGVFGGISVSKSSVKIASKDIKHPNY